MKKKKLLTGVIIGSLLVLVGCTNYEEEYNTTSKELEELKEEYESIKEELESEKKIVENLKEQIEEGSIYLNLDNESKDIINVKIEEVKAQRQQEIEEKRLEEEKRKIDEENFDGNVWTNVRVEESSDGKIKLYGETNMPDGTEVTLTFRSHKDKYDYNYLPGNDLACSSNGVVENGKFESEWLSDRGEGFSPGTYYFVMEASRVDYQPISIQNKVAKWIGKEVNDHGDVLNNVMSYQKK